MDFFLERRAGTMKKLQIFLCAIVLMLGVVGISNAILIDNLDGTVTQIRVDGSILMWLEDANYAFTSGYDSDGLMAWDQANDWIGTLNASNRLKYNDCRLPDTNPVDGSSYIEESTILFAYYPALQKPATQVLA